ncbi:LytTR family DNA-binding domain-containing protein [Lysinibacillus agricola]|uniref:LytTR family DNA-binding domain-containing protein n=1 Tax=Lysinibacillus agricola TaxID=2590012 RepID=UPI003C19C029
MNINYIWKDDQPVNEIDMISNPINENMLLQLEKSINSSVFFNAINPKNNRMTVVELSKIEAIESLGHLSKLILYDGSELLLKKILKELNHLEHFDFFRINNSTILNLLHIDSFGSGSHARLEIFTKNNHKYMVSRHYAKKIKERLL